MLNKKIKLIIFGGISLLIIIGFYFILATNYKTNNNNSVNGGNTNNANSVNKEEVEKININVATTTQSENIIEPIIDKKAEEARNAKYLVKLKDNHPEYSVSQLEFYSATAAKKEMIPCLGKNDESSCISAVAFITRSDNFCGEVKDKNKQLECADIILNEEAEAKIKNCQLSGSGSSLARCLIDIFGIYKKPENCVNLISEDLKSYCASAAYYQGAIELQDEKMCGNVTNESIKNYCLEGVAVKSQDSDNDGLSDAEEAVYGTNPNLADTDGDGYSDGDEVKSGHNPNGQ